MKYLTIFLVSGLVMCGFGWWFKPAAVEEESSIREKSISRLSPATRLRKVDSKIARAEWIQKIHDAGKNEYSVLLVRIGKIENEELRQELADELLKRWNKLPLEDFQSFRSMVEGADDDVLDLLKGAVVRNEEFRDDFVEMLVKELPKHGHEAAAMWAFGLLEQGRDHGAFRELCVAWAKENPKSALSMLGNLGSGSVAHLLAVEIGNSVKVSRVEEIEEMAAMLEGEVQERFYGAVISQSIDQLDEEALAQRFGKEEPTEILEKVVIGYAVEDPERAFQWINRFESDDCRTVAAEAICRHWSKEDPQGALKFVRNSYPGSPFLAQSIFTGVSQSRQGPESAWELLQAMPDGVWMSHAMQGLYAALPEESAKADFERMLANEKDPRIRSAGLKLLGAQ